jgi:hypothetical protein
MKPQYDEGREVAGRFEEAMKLLFQTPKPEVDRKEKQTRKAATSRKPKKD